MGKVKKILDETASSSVYNKAYKEYLQHTGKLRCSWCGYHSGENFTGKYYYYKNDDDATYPSWKLSTKNKKQWMSKKEKPKRHFLRLYGNRIIDIIDYK